MHYDLPEYYLIKSHKPKIQRFYEKHKKKLLWALFDCYKVELVIYTILVAISCIIEFMLTIYSGKAMDKVASGANFRDPAVIKQLAYYFGMMSSLNLITTLISAYNDFMIENVVIGIGISTFSMLQDKIFRYRILNSTKFTEGYITNLIQVDADQVGQMISNASTAIQRTVKPLIAFIYMIYVVGWRMTLFSLMIYMALKTTSIIVLWLRYVVTKALMLAKDKRMTIFSNVIENLEFIKINALENFFCYEVFKKREKEIKQLRNNALVFVLNRFISATTGPGAEVLIFLCFFWWRENTRTNYGAYTSFLQLYGSATFELHNLVYIFVFIFRALANFNRVEEFLAYEDDGQKIRHIEESRASIDAGRRENATDVAIEVLNGNFEWKKAQTQFDKQETMEDVDERNRLLGNTARQGGNAVNDEGDIEMVNLNAEEVRTPLNDQAENKLKNQNSGRAQSHNSNPFNFESDQYSDQASRGSFQLKNINLKIFKGDKIAIIGKSNSGKSSLLYSLLGEMLPTDGSSRIKRTGKVALLTQQRWLIGDTIKENILLGEKYNEEMMVRALKASQLVKDLEFLTNGIETVLSDNGDTVSGGQRARIALARCFYQK